MQEPIVLPAPLDHTRQELVCFPFLNVYHVTLGHTQCSMEPLCPQRANPVNQGGINQDQDPINALYALREPIRQDMGLYL